MLVTQKKKQKYR